MRFFSIAEIVGFSCVKAHTIRIWEQRLQIPQPRRADGNIRSYSLKDVEYFLKISLLNKAGYKISMLALMDSEIIEKNISTLKSLEDQQCRELHKLIISMFSTDTEQFDSILDSCMLNWGIDNTISHIIIPFLERVKIETCKNCDAEADFAITAIRKKLIVGIENAKAIAIKNKTALLFLPDGEYFDLLLLYFNYIMKSFGVKVLYMGTNVSVQKLKTVCDAKQPDFLLTYISPNNKKGLNELKQYLSEKSAIKCFIAGFENFIIKKIDEPNVRFLHHSVTPHAISEVINH